MAALLNTPQLQFATLDVFTSTRYAGNPLAVVRIPSGEHVSTEQMQTIAREFNLSETIFVHDGRPSEDDGVMEWRVRIFLTKAEIPFAGHPTIGAAVYALGTLANNVTQGRLIASAGAIQLKYTAETRIATASIPHNFHLHTQHPFTLEELYKLQPTLNGVVTSQDAIQVCSPVRGMNFVQAELPTLEALASISTSGKPQPQLDKDWNVGFSGSHFYVFTASPVKVGEVEKFQLRTRMIEGVFEDPATGSAACALTSHLALKRASSRISHFEITQGIEMERKSDIEVTVTLNEALTAIEKVHLGGTAVKVMEGVLEC